MKVRSVLVLAFLAAASPRASEEPRACCRGDCLADGKPAAPLAPRSLYQLDATWTDDAGGALPLASLRGHAVVLAMFFTRCEYACPLLVHELKQMREALPADARAKTRFVLVSFDTARDTPAALRAYRERAQLGDGWTLLRGEADDVQTLAMVLGVKFKADARGQFSHSNLITVLDAEGEIAHQRAGLQGDSGDSVRAIIAAAR